MKMLKKISVKTVCGYTVKQIRDMAEAADMVTGAPIMRVIGMATGTKSGESDFGPWAALRGRFEAIDFASGEVSGSGVCFLPDMGHDLVAAELANSDGVQFAFDIAVLPSDTSGPGYEYTVIPLTDTTENDPLKALKKELPELPKLPAPSKK